MAFKVYCQMLKTSGDTKGQQCTATNGSIETGSGRSEAVKAPEARTQLRKAKVVQKPEHYKFLS